MKLSRKQQEIYDRTNELWYRYVVDGKNQTELAQEWHMTHQAISLHMKKIERFPDLKEKYEEIRRQQYEQEKQVLSIKKQRLLQKKQQLLMSVVDDILLTHASYLEIAQKYHIGFSTVAWHVNNFEKAHPEYREALQQVRKENQQIVSFTQEQSLTKARQVFAFLLETAVPVRVAAYELHFPVGMYEYYRQLLLNSNCSSDQELVFSVSLMLEQEPQRAPILILQK